MKTQKAIVERSCVINRFFLLMIEKFIHCAKRFKNLIHFKLKIKFYEACIGLWTTQEGE